MRFVFWFVIALIVAAYALIISYWCKQPIPISLKVHCICLQCIGVTIGITTVVTFLASFFKEDK